MRAIHVVGANVSPAARDEMMEDIVGNRRLKISQAAWGTAVFAFTDAGLPRRFQTHPAVLFAVDANRYEVRSTDFGTETHLEIRDPEHEEYVFVEIIQPLNWPPVK